MNIFYFSHSPETCARMHCDRHNLKMIVEYLQILSTVHRVLDGTMVIRKSKSGRNQKYWKLPNDFREESFYKATHVNHPSVKWACHSKGNYRYLHSLTGELLKEYTHRYGKYHSCTQLWKNLNFYPGAMNEKPVSNKDTNDFCPPWRAMPDEYKVDKSDPFYCENSYRNYFIGKKQHIAKWTKREVPFWFKIQ